MSDECYRVGGRISSASRGGLTAGRSGSRQPTQRNQITSRGDTGRKGAPGRAPARSDHSSRHWPRWPCIDQTRRFRPRDETSGSSSATERDVTWLGLSMLADLSPDGARVLFTVFPEGEDPKDAQTYIRQTNGTPAVRLGEGEALALSPDGKWALTQRLSPSRLVLLPTGEGTANDTQELWAHLSVWRIVVPRWSTDSLQRAREQRPAAHVCSGHRWWRADPGRSSRLAVRSSRQMVVRSRS